MNLTSADTVAPGRTPADPDANPSYDGRRARRDRNSEAVIESVLTLLSEGEAFPTAQQVAQRSGVSLRSVFRYFDDLDAMAHAAISTFVERNIDALIFSPPPPGTPLEDRIGQWCRFRADGLEVTGTSQLAALERARRQPTLRAIIEQLRHQSAATVGEVFAPELAELAPEVRERTTALLHSVTIIEVWVNLRHRLGLSAEATAAAFDQAVRGVLAQAGVTTDRT